MVLDALCLRLVTSDTLLVVFHVLGRPEQSFRSGINLTSCDAQTNLTVSDTVQCQSLHKQENTIKKQIKER